MTALVFGYYVKSLACGGSIISQKHILTAAHCILPFVIWDELSPNLKGVIGSNYWNSTNIITFVDHKTHPDWNWATLKNDIGLLITEKEIIFNKNVAPVKLNFDFIKGGDIGYVTGWGQVGVYEDIPAALQLLYLRILSPKQCKIGVFIAALLTNSNIYVDSEVEICTLHSKNRGMCRGDSGSPLNLADTHQQVGIVSWGFPCANGHPDMYARLSGFKLFLKKALGKYYQE